MRGLSVLIIDDDQASAERLAGHLVAAGHRVRLAGSMAAGLRLRATEAPDVTVLDRMIGGVDTLTQIAPIDGRLFPEPVLVLTALTTPSDRIAGLDAGADDYLVKPADPAEVEARLRALVRRPKGAAAAVEKITCGALTVDRIRREAWGAGRRIALQPREFRLLEELALAGGDVVTRKTLLDRVWNLGFDPRTKLIETHVSRLRDKLAVADGMPTILTVRGSGYSLTAR